jgi:hypothetical protein
VTTYYSPGCCSSCGGVGCSSCGVSYGCSSCGTGCSNCSTYYPDSTGSSSDTNSTYSNSVESSDPTDAQSTDPRDDDFGPNNRSTNETGDGDSIPDNDEEFESPFNPAPGEPTNAEEPPMAAPLNVGPQLTWQVIPTRSRVHVESDIRTPRVARVEAAPNAVPNLSALRVASFEN